MTLNDSTITVFWAYFSDYTPTRFAPLLSTNEHTRAQRFISDDVRDRFIIGRGLLRTALGQHLNRAPESLVFDYGAQGKPIISDAPLHFNLSHSADMLLLALATHPLGADVEQIRPMTGQRTVAHDNFSPAEFAVWSALPAAEQSPAFFNIWTRKEAYIKATGDGFRLPLAAFDVTHDQPARFLRIDGDDLTRWRLHHLILPGGYVGAVCCHHRAESIILSPLDV